jgi:signal transduction histidine kinase
VLIRWTPGDRLAGEVTKSPGREKVEVLRRFGARRRHLAFWVALWTAAVAAEIAVLRPALFDRDTPVRGLEVVFACVGGSFAACGLVAWRRRPDSRSGALMTATGFAFSLPAVWGQIDAPLAGTLAIWFVDLWTVLFVALLVSLLTAGRLETTVDKLLVFAFVLPLLILNFVWLLVAEEVEPNVLLAFPHEGIADVIDKIQRSLLLGACLTTAVVLGLRWRAATRPRRRALLPTIAGSFVLLVYAALLINDLASGERSEALLWVASCSLVTVPLAFLAGLLRSRLARSGLADLFRDLRNLDHAALQATLARALGDPGLRLAYAGADGTLPEADSARSVTPLVRAGRPFAALVYDPSLDDDPELVEAVSAAASIALENEHLQAESQARLTELMASRERIVAAGDAERRRLERNLHDGAQQRLVALAMQLRLIQAEIRMDPAAAEARVTSASGELAESLGELRELARGIHPAVLEYGLSTALEALAGRSPVPTAVSWDVTDRLPQKIELAAYFVACESLANVAKYAHASAASVHLSRTDGSLIVEIADDGVGGADAAVGSGLRGLADRVEALGGHLLVTSPAGEGTVVTAELPLVASPVP